MCLLSRVTCGRGGYDYLHGSPPLCPPQPLNQSLDDIVVSVPQTPAHGAVARLPSQVSAASLHPYPYSMHAHTHTHTQICVSKETTSRCAHCMY